MGFNPVLDLLCLAVAVFTQFVFVKRLHRGLMFFVADLPLPDFRKDIVYIIVQILTFENFPLVIVKPHSTAITATVHAEIYAVPNRIMPQKMPAFGAQFRICGVFDFDLTALCRGIF